MKKILISLGIVALLGSCSVDTGLNVDQKHPTTVPSAGLFTNATINLFNQMNTCSVNSNVLRLYSQYWAQTTYPDESQYNQSGRNISGAIWNTMYRDVLQDLKGAKEAIEANPNEENSAQKLAVIEFLSVYAYSVLIDTFGNVPYTDALDSNNPSPAYDDAATVYVDLLNRLQAAIPKMSGSGFDSTSDVIYGGKMAQWKMAANSLMLRMALRLADVNAGVSKAMAEAAAPGAIMSNANNFTIPYLGSDPNTNPLWVNLVQSGRNDYVAANTLVDKMNALSDGRLASYFEKDSKGNYSGGIYGNANAASGFSALGNMLKDPTLPGTLISASEVEFLLAEAKERGYNISGTAEEHYNKGISNSFLEWGLTQADADTYMANAGVAYATAMGDWKEKIATQKWIAMFNNGMEGWTTYRLLDMPKLNGIDGAAKATVPTRFIYPTSEATLNGSAYSAAASAIGGDTKETKLFWDVK